MKEEKRKLEIKEKKINKTIGEKKRKKKKNWR